MDKRLIYLIVGLFTLFFSILGATFAYYTVTSSNNNTITGDMATIDINLSVTKMTNVDETNGGLVPMDNSMIEKAVTSSNGICVDDNTNAVCQIYKIVVNNIGSAAIFLDGYVTLIGGLGTATDYITSPTTMRWSQVFCSENNHTLSSCTTAGTSTVSQTNSISWGALGGGTDNVSEIKDDYDTVVGTGTISGNDYDVIDTNYIRVSKHSGNGYIRDDDVTSALVFNQLLNSSDDNSSNDTGDSSVLYTDSQVYYIVVWLSETWTNQSVGSGGVNVPNLAEDFFHGSVSFISAEGSKVTAIFSGYTGIGSGG